MRRILTLVFALALVAAACGDDDASVTTAAPTTSIAAAEQAEEHMDDAGHEEGDEHAEDEHMDDAGHEEGDEHAEDTHMDDDAMAVLMEQLSEESIPEAIGEVTVEYTIEMSEFAFEHGGVEVSPGDTVRFVLVNNGTLVHEFRLTTKHKAEEHVASGHEGHGEEGGEHHEDADIIVNVLPGETRTVEMTIPDHAEIDQIACLIPGHYEAGMFLDV